MPSSFNKYRLKGAYHYDWYENESWYKTLIDRAVGFCQGPTLDVGCGDGLLANKISEKYQVTGIDIDEDGLKLARERQSWIGDGETIFEFIDAQNPFGGRWWDYMACLNVIEHLDRPECLWDIIDKDIFKGAIISTIDYQGGSLGEDHKREYTMDELMDFFKKYNPKPFRIEDIWIGVEIKL